jgi:hypothetical protein
MRDTFLPIGVLPTADRLQLLHTLFYLLGGKLAVSLDRLVDAFGVLTDD